MDFPIEAKLKDGTPIQLTLADHRDSEPLRQLFQTIIEEGASYPHDRLPGQDDFMAYWFTGTSTIVSYQQGSRRGADLLGDDGACAREPVRHEIVLAGEPIVGIGGAFFNDGLEQLAQRLAVPVVSQGQLDRRAVLEFRLDREVHSLIKLRRSAKRNERVH